MWRVILTLASISLGLAAAAGELSETENLRLRAARPGAVVQLPEFLKRRADLPVLPVTIAPDVGPQFLFSDKPEYFHTGNGLALQEDVQPGFVRLYLYHVPTPAETHKTITAVIENLGEKPLRLSFRCRAAPSPSSNYHQAAKAALAQFLEPKQAKGARTIAARTCVPLDPLLDGRTAGRDELVHAIYEFEVTQPARVTVLQRDPEQKSIEALNILPKLPQTLPGHEKGNGAGRGLFATSDFLVLPPPGFVLDTTNGPVQLILADGQRDPWMRGHDSLDGAVSRNVGNYGALYRLRLKRAGSDGRGWALLMCQVPGHTKSCGKIGAVVRVNAGTARGGVIMLPSDRVVFGGEEEAVLIQRFPPVPKGETGVVELTYSPPGACCLPTPLIFVPYEP